MPDKIFYVFRKVDRSVSTIESLQRTAERVESRTNEGGFIPIFVIAVVVAAVAAAGVGIYLYKKAMAAPESPALLKETQKETGEVGKMGFGCKDLLPDGDFLTITGANPGEFDFDSAVTPYFTLECSYAGKENTRFFDTSLVFAVAWEPVGGEQMFTLVKPPDAKNVGGIGSTAYYTSEFSSQLVVLSSNKKYTISVDSLALGRLFWEKVESERIKRDIAKTIDRNLNKY